MSSLPFFVVGNVDGAGDAPTTRFLLLSLTHLANAAQAIKENIIFIATFEPNLGRFPLPRGLTGARKRRITLNVGVHSVYLSVLAACSRWNFHEPSAMLLRRAPNMSSLRSLLVLASAGISPVPIRAAVANEYPLNDGLRNPAPIQAAGQNPPTYPAIAVPGVAAPLRNQLQPNMAAPSHPIQPMQPAPIYTTSYAPSISANQPYVYASAPTAIPQHAHTQPQIHYVQGEQRQYVSQGAQTSMPHAGYSSIPQAQYAGQYGSMPPQYASAASQPRVIVQGSQNGYTQGQYVISDGRQAVMPHGGLGGYAAMPQAQPQPKDINIREATRSGCAGQRKHHHRIGRHHHHSKPKPPKSIDFAYPRPVQTPKNH
ncbi:hypothetical protein R3P38DRAFT_2764796 [Favolaschia claudopus]|uniref:Uncharacterized protein n=1 Tax=Favolaschia claudopus TaxID=2862362 RepID=A0AAW0DC47_9AGAR